MNERFKNYLPEGEPFALLGEGTKKARNASLPRILELVKSGREYFGVPSTSRSMFEWSVNAQLYDLNVNVCMTEQDFGAWMKILGLMLNGRGKVFEALGEEDVLKIAFERVNAKDHAFECGVSSITKIEINDQCIGYVYPDGQKRDTPVVGMTKTQTASTYRSVLESNLSLGCGDFVMPHGLYDTGYPIERFEGKKVDGRAQVLPEGTLKAARWVDANRICWQENLGRIQSRIKRYFHMSR